MDSRPPVVYIVQDHLEGFLEQNWVGHPKVEMKDGIWEGWVEMGDMEMGDVERTVAD